MTEATTRESDRWLELSVAVAREYAEPVTHLFSKHGDGRVYVGESGDWNADDDPDPDGAEPSPTDVVTVCGYLTLDDTVEHRKGMIDVGLRLIGQLTTVGDLCERELDAAEWSSQPAPVARVGSRLLIAPAELDDAAVGRRRGDVRVSLAPGLAFGTGTHPTTRMCLTELDAMAHAGELDGCDVLDVGTGSGILSIAALLLRARRAWCLDTDETAVRAATMNTRASGVGDRAEVISGTLPSGHPEVSEMRCGLVVANITSKVLEELAPHICERVAPSGTLLLSGILADHADATLPAFTRFGMEQLARRQDGDWVMYRLRLVGSGDPA